MTHPLRQLLIGFGALILLAGCANSPYRTGYYYPAADGHGDYYSAPAERYRGPYYGPYYPYYGPYYYGFYHYPYHHGFYGFYHLGHGFGSPHGHSFYRLGFGYGFGDPYFGDPYFGGHYAPHRFHHVPHHRSDRRFRRGEDHEPAPIWLLNRPGDAERHLRRNPPAKNDPDLRYPQRQRAFVPGPAAAPQPTLAAARAALALEQERERRIEPYGHRLQAPPAPPRLLRPQTPSPPQPVKLVNRPQQAPVRIATSLAFGQEKSFRKGSPTPAPVTRAVVSERRAEPRSMPAPMRAPAAPAAVATTITRPAPVISRTAPASRPPRTTGTPPASKYGNAEPTRSSELEHR